MILTVLTIISLIGLLSYYIIFSRIKISSFLGTNKEFQEAISVIICAKNELTHIKRFFPSWLNQNHPNFELIIVNDQSTDGSFEYLNSLALVHNNLKIVNIQIDIEKSLLGKRHALFEGIKVSKNEYLLFTDADCEPSSPNWISEMTNAFVNTKTEIVLGFSPYFKEKSFVNRLVQYETFLTALQYFGWANFGKPYMSVGRNVAYKKSLLNNSIFEKSNKSISGDDDLVFQQIATKENTAYQISTNSIVYSVAPESLKNWILQKKRHFKAGIHYPLEMKFILGMFSFLNFAFIFLVFFLLFQNIYTALLIIFLRQLFSLFLLHKNKIYKITNFHNFIEFIILDSIYWLFYSIFAFALIL